MIHARRIINGTTKGDARLQLVAARSTQKPHGPYTCQAPKGAKCNTERQHGYSALVAVYNSVR